MSIQNMSTDKLLALRDSIDKELNDRDEDWYGTVMEDPEAYRERVMDDSPFADTDSLKDHLNECAANDPFYFERPEPRCG